MRLGQNHRFILLIRSVQIFQINIWENFRGISHFVYRSYMSKRTLNWILNNWMIKLLISRSSTCLTLIHHKIAKVSNRQRSMSFKWLFYRKTVLLPLSNLAKFHIFNLFWRFALEFIFIYCPLIELSFSIKSCYLLNSCLNLNQFRVTFKTKWRFWNIEFPNKKITFSSHGWT